MAEQGSYYVPESTRMPIIASLGMLLLLVGAATWIHKEWYGPYAFAAGALVIVGIMFAWFGMVIRENQLGLYDRQMDRSFRWSMIWFIFSEVFFFAAFFGALFYIRWWVVPVLGGVYHPITNLVLWPDFQAAWPLLSNPDNQHFIPPKEVMNTWDLPFINTLILLTSGATVTWAHWALKENNRKQLVIGLILTVLLGALIVVLQAYEYYEAYHELDLTLASGAYGMTFFMLTGFHGLHVTIGTIMLIVITLRAMWGHFTPKNHFAFEGVAWYWHFVDVVWLFLFVFVYWL